MKTFRELCNNKPSVAIQAMVDGLRRQDKRSGFFIKMSVYGEYDRSSQICFGCAATCAVQELTKYDFKSSNINDSITRSAVLNVGVKDLDNFEIGIDSFRRGEVKDIFRYFGITDIIIPNFLWCLRSENWEDQLPLIEEYIEELKSLGL